jgi:hypothetical protein
MLPSPTPALQPYRCEEPTRSARRRRHVTDRRRRAIERCVRACQIMQLVGGVAGLLIYISVTAANIRFFPFLVSLASASPCSPPALTPALPTRVVPAMAV